jgi:hypothetical protein
MNETIMNSNLTSNKQKNNPLLTCFFSQFHCFWFFLCRYTVVPPPQPFPRRVSRNIIEPKRTSWSLPPSRYCQLFSPKEIQQSIICYFDWIVERFSNNQSNSIFCFWYFMWWILRSSDSKWCKGRRGRNRTNLNDDKQWKHRKSTTDFLQLLLYLQNWESNHCFAALFSFVSSSFELQG